jgi:hypothetical protein
LGHALENGNTPPARPAVVPEYGLRLSAALRAVIEHKPPAGITLGYIIAETGERAFGVLMAFLCLPFLLPLLPGVSVPFGLALVLLGLQLAVGWHRPWLPRRMLAWRLPEKVTAKIVAGVATLFKPLEKVCRPRLAFMQNRAAYVAVGLALAVQGVILALPIPIPGTNSVPAWMALILILGITEEDGVTMIVGLLLTAAAVAAVALLAVFGAEWVTGKKHGKKAGASQPSAHVQAPG